MLDVAVVIPVFNGADWIGATLKSVLNQSKTPLEVVVVDDGSSDHSLEIVRAFQEVKVFANPGKGPQQARDFGWRQTMAPLIAMLDQDDLWHPDHLMTMIRLLEEHPACMASVGGVHKFQAGQEPVFSMQCMDACLLDPWLSFPSTPVHTPSAAVFRRIALEAMGCWPTTFLACNDMYAWLMMSIHHPLVRCRAISVGYRIHRHSFSSKLRMGHSQQFFEAILACGTQALEQRRLLLNDDTAWWELRLQGCRSLAPVLRAYVSHCRVTLHEKALLLERTLAEESEEFLLSVLNVLFYLVAPSLQQEDPRRAAGELDTLLGSWPAQAVRSRQLLLRRLGRQVTVRCLCFYLLLAPWQAHRWQLLLSRLPAALRYKLGRR